MTDLSLHETRIPSNCYCINYCNYYKCKINILWEFPDQFSFCFYHPSNSDLISSPLPFHFSTVFEMCIKHFARVKISLVMTQSNIVNIMNYIYIFNYSL